MENRTDSPYQYVEALLSAATMTLDSPAAVGINYSCQSLWRRG